MDAIERVALSFGLSIAITPLLGLALNYTPFGILLLPILIVLSIFDKALFQEMGRTSFRDRRYKSGEEDVEGCG